MHGWGRNLYDLLPRHSPDSHIHFSIPSLLSVWKTKNSSNLEAFSMIANKCCYNRAHMVTHRGTKKWAESSKPAFHSLKGILENKKMEHSHPDVTVWVMREHLTNEKYRKTSTLDTHSNHLFLYFENISSGLLTEYAVFFKHSINLFSRTQY